VSAPNEPGQPGPGANGGSGEVPPWQRGATRARQGGAPNGPGAQQRPPAEGQQPRPPAGPPSSIEQRVNRFITGSAAPDMSGVPGPPPSRPEHEAPANRPEQRPEPRQEQRPEPRAEQRTEVARPEAYGSELPDLSGSTPPKPTQQQRKPAPEPSPRPAAGAAARVQAAAGRSRGPVRASMQIRHIDPWSALKVSLLLSVALFFVWMIAVAFLYLVLGGMGVWSKLNSNVGDLLTATSGGGGELVSSGTIFGGAALIGLVNIVLLTAMATVGAFIYNLSTDIVGGIEVTLADRD